MDGRIFAHYGCGPVKFPGSGDATFREQVAKAKRQEKARFAGGDRYMHLADLRSYLEASDRVERLHGDPRAWTGMVVRNVASSGRFSSDRTISEYAAGIWNAVPCPVP